MSEKQKQMQDFLNRKRKMDMKTKVEENPTTSSEKEAKLEEKGEDDEKKKQEQFEKAKKALIFDAKRAKDRADTVGPQGFLKPKSLGTNKNFLRRTIESTLPRRPKKATEDEK